MSDFRVEAFDNGLTLYFRDSSNRYFGDYHRVLIEIEARVETGETSLRLKYQRPLQKMAVAGDEVERCRSELVEQFLRTTAAYLRQEDMVTRMLTALERPGQKLWRRVD